MLIRCRIMNGISWASAIGLGASSSVSGFGHWHRANVKYSNFETVTGFLLFELRNGDRLFAGV